MWTPDQPAWYEAIEEFKKDVKTLPRNPSRYGPTSCYTCARKLLPNDQRMDSSGGASICFLCYERFVMGGDF